MSFDPTKPPPEVVREFRRAMIELTPFAPAKFIQSPRQPYYYISEARGTTMSVHLYGIQLTSGLKTWSLTVNATYPIEARLHEKLADALSGWRKLYDKVDKGPVADHCEYMVSLKDYRPNGS